MTENIRTVTYLGVALVLITVAAVVNRKPAVETEETLAGKILFPALKSPADVGALEIVTTADGVSQSEFNLKRDADGWTLPSHGGYPADAEKQVASATASLVDLKALSVVSTSASEHAEYGVLDPEKASPGAEGIGKLVKVLDKSGNNLARLVIGKKDAEGGGALDGRELWFVRALPADAVYRVALPTAKFSTSFADWIETDLLKLNAWDISEVTLKDYTFDIGRDLSGRIAKNYDQLSTIELAFNEQDSKWSLKNLILFEKDQPKPVELGAGEELNTTRLNEMKTALDDLKIVSVRAKPAGMSANLRADKSIFEDLEALQSLADRGFYAMPGEGGQPEILSSDGEVLVRMKDGVEYTLRFGGVAGVGSEVKDDDTSGSAAVSKSAGKTKQDEPKGATLNRFIMVSARFNKDLIPKPGLEPVPGEAAGEKTEDSSKADADETKTPAAETEAKEPAVKTIDQNKDEGKSSDDSGPAPKDDKSAASANESLHFVKLQADPDDAGKAKAAPAKTDDAKTNGKSKQNGEAKKDDSAKPADDAKADATTKADATKTEGDDAKANEKQPSPENKEDLALRRKQIETENQRKQKEYDDKVKKGEERAQELNARFAEWYYVVSEDTYRKIHLNRGDVIKAKADEKTGGKGAADPLGIPPLNIDPFQKRDEASEEKDEGQSTKDE